MDDARTWNSRLLGDAGTQWTWLLRRLLVQVQKAERSNLPGFRRWMGQRGTCVLPLHNLHRGAGPTTTENWDTLRDRDTYDARTGILGQDCVLLQTRDHEEERKRSRHTVLEENEDRRVTLRMSMWMWACLRVRACARICAYRRVRVWVCACVYVCERVRARAHCVVKK